MTLQWWSLVKPFSEDGSHPFSVSSLRSCDSQDDLLSFCHHNNSLFLTLLVVHQSCEETILIFESLSNFCWPYWMFLQQENLRLALGMVSYIFCRIHSFQHINQLYKLTIITTSILQQSVKLLTRSMVHLSIEVLEIIFQHSMLHGISVLLYNIILSYCLIFLLSVSMVKSSSVIVWPLFTI